MISEKHYYTNILKEDISIYSTETLKHIHRNIKIYIRSFVSHEKLYWQKVGWLEINKHTNIAYFVPQPHRINNEQFVCYNNYFTYWNSQLYNNICIFVSINLYVIIGLVLSIMSLRIVIIIKYYYC